VAIPVFTMVGTRNSLAIVAMCPVGSPTSVRMAFAFLITFPNRGDVCLATSIAPWGKLSRSTSLLAI